MSLRHTLHRRADLLGTTAMVAVALAGACAFGVIAQPGPVSTVARAVDARALWVDPGFHPAWADVQGEPLVHVEARDDLDEDNERKFLRLIRVPLGSSHGDDWGRGPACPSSAGRHAISYGWPLLWLRC